MYQAAHLPSTVAEIYFNLPAVKACQFLPSFSPLSVSRTILSDPPSLSLSYPLFLLLSSPFFLHRRFLASLLLLPFFFSFFRFHSVYHYACHFLLPAPPPLSCHASSSTRPLHIDFPPQTEEGRDGRRRLPVSRVKADVT